MKKFLRENFVLAAGIALPLLLVIFFWLATWLPTLYVDPPQYDLLYTVRDYDYDAPGNLAVRIEARDGQAVIRVYPRWSSDYNSRYENFRLYRFDVKTNRSHEIDYSGAMDQQVPVAFYSCSKPGPESADAPPLPLDQAKKTKCEGAQNASPKNSGDYITLNVPELNAIKLYPNRDRFAPDGYIFTVAGDYRRGLMNEIFYSSQSRTSFALVKDGRSVPIEDPTGRSRPYYYNDNILNFVGWIKKD